MKYHDIWALSFDKLKLNPSTINDYCVTHKLLPLAALHMQRAIDFMECSACCHMSFKYPDCYIAVTRNIDTSRYLFELHVPVIDY